MSLYGVWCLANDPSWPLAATVRAPSPLPWSPWQDGRTRPPDCRPAVGHRASICLSNTLAPHNFADSSWAGSRVERPLGLIREIRVAIGARITVRSWGCALIPPRGPFVDRGKGWVQRIPPRGQAIADPNRRPAVNQTLHDAGYLQVAKTLGQDLVRDPRNGGEEPVVANLVAADQQRSQDHARPASADELDGPLKAVAMFAGYHGDRDRLALSEIKSFKLVMSRT